MKQSDVVERVKNMTMSHLSKLLLLFEAAFRNHNAFL